MAGRRRTGAAAALVGNLYLQDRQRRQQRDMKWQEFQQRLQEAGIKSALEQGRISYNVQTGRLETPTQEASGLLQQTLPQTPYVAGPGGSFITGSQVEALPSSVIPRQSVIDRTAPVVGDLLQRQRQGGQMQPIFIRKGDALRQIGMIPKGAKIITEKENDLDDVLDSGIEPILPQGGGRFALQPPAAADEMIQVLDPGDGQIKRIPRSRLQEALRRGGQLVQ